MNYPRRRPDGVLTPDFRGVLETDDRATIVFSWNGLTRSRDGRRELVGSLTHLSDDHRYRAWNDCVCAVAGEVRERDGGGFDVVLDVFELVWQPLAGGTLTAITGSTQPLGTDSAGPAQISFAPDGATLVVTEKTSSTIDTYVVGPDGRAQAPHVFASAGAVPFGFDFDNRGHLLVSNASNSASSYAIGGDGSVSVVSGAVATHQGAPCWLVATRNGRYAYTANAAAGTISGFAVAADGALTLLDPSGVSANLGAGSHPLDEAVSRNGRFLYDLVDGAHALGGFRIADDGSLTPVGMIGGLPAGSVRLAAA